MAFTKEQLEAINKEGTNIIVSAGAGSGKTAVLTQRVIRKLKEGVDVDKILVLTFTNEAAGEMKSRIRKAIIENKLDKQLALLDSSYITTFDSFAFSILKKYHYTLNINPNVKIIDSNIIKILKYRVIDEIFLEKYKEKDSNFTKLINDFCLKDDKSVKEYIIKLSDNLELLLDKDKYIENYIDNFYNEEFISSVIKKYIDIIFKKINELRNTYDNLNMYITESLASKLNIYLAPLFNSNNYDDMHNFLTMEAPRFSGVDENGKEYKEELKKIIEDIKNLLRFESLEEIKESLQNTKEYVTVIIDIIKKLDTKIKEYKSTYDIYEFNDIAHFAIKIVKENDDIREELKSYFNEIMVDEYQDTSIIQEEFISLISNNNVYMVGDIKQSIYRFRNANPYIFQDKYNKYSNNIGGYKIDLLKNFRSRSETLFNINEIFNIIMDEEIGNAAYLESHNMVYGNTDYDKEDTKVNNYLEIYNYDCNEFKDYKDYEKELFIIAEDIEKKINSNYQVFDKETKLLRNITYSDICIITDRNKYLDTYKKILEYKNIPSVLFKDEVLTNDTDILIIKNLINLVYLVNNNIYNNKFRYLFTSVARSFLFNYTDKQIYNIFKNKEFYKDKIVNKCKNIDIYTPLEEIVNNIIIEFNIYEKLTILNNIDASIIRINNLIEILSNLNSLGYTLEEFIEYFDKVIEIGLDIKYSVNTGGSDSVKIMNIHKSKGLEFSLCYFTGMQNKFTIKDVKELVLFKEDLGFILPYYKEELKDTILKDIFKDNFFIEEVSEKIRLFYVALTRCREKMIIVTSLGKERNSYTSMVPSNIRINYRSFLDILNSCSAIDKYVIDIEGNYTKDYNNFKDINIANNDNSIKLEKRINTIEYSKKNTEHFSKKVNKLIELEEFNNMKYGTKIHEILEFSNFNTKDNPYIKKLLDKIDNNYINIYREYEFTYKEDNILKHGVIDLMLEYSEKFMIIDYKLNNIVDDAYLKQLNGYKKYISSMTSKNIEIYLYSLNSDILKKL